MIQLTSVVKRNDQERWEGLPWGGGPWAEAAWSGGPRGGGGGDRFRVVAFNWEGSLGPVEFCLLVRAVLQAFPRALDIEESWLGGLHYS